MSILSTNKKLIKAGQDYSAGSGISIDDHVISVTGAGAGKTYSAGDNISIYEQDEQLYISSKDWANDIANASANAYNEAVAQIPDPFDPSYISGQIDNKLNTTAFTAWQNGQYATDLQTIEGQISNKLDESAFSDVSGSFYTNDNPSGFITGVDLSNYYTKDETSGKEELANAFANIPAGDTEVNAYVHNHSASIDNTSDLVQSNSSTWNDITAYQSNSASYLTAIDIPESATWNETSDVVQTNSAQWADGGSGDEEVNSFVYNNSATINNVDSVVQSNSATWANEFDPSYMSGAIDNKLDESAFSNVSGTFLTAINIPESADWNDTTDVVQTNSASWGTGSTPTYDYTDNDLISAIDASALYSTSAGTANTTRHILTNGTMGESISYYDGINQMFLNPNITPFGTISGIYGPLQYATGAVITYGSSGKAGSIYSGTQYFGGFLKGNEWYVSNATAGQALRGETHKSRGVHLSGVTTAGNSFDLSTSAVSGNNDTANGYNWKLERGCVSGKGTQGEWRYGPAEDTLLRSVSSNAGGFYSTSALLYQGSKSDQRTTAWNLTKSISSYKFIQCDWIDANYYYISKQINIPSGLEGDMTRAAFFDAVFEHGSDLWCKAQRFSAQDTTVYAQVDEYCVHTNGTISNVGSDVRNNRPIMVQIIGVK